MKIPADFLNYYCLFRSFSRIWRFSSPLPDEPIQFRWLLTIYWKNAFPTPSCLEYNEQRKCGEEEQTKKGENRSIIYIKKIKRKCHVNKICWTNGGRGLLSTLSSTFPINITAIISARLRSSRLSTLLWRRHFIVFAKHSRWQHDNVQHHFSINLLNDNKNNNYNWKTLNFTQFTIEKMLNNWVEGGNWQMAEGKDGDAIVIINLCKIKWFL